jgi:hypothetical protein
MLHPLSAFASEGGVPSPVPALLIEPAVLTDPAWPVELAMPP